VVDAPRPEVFEADAVLVDGNEYFSSFLRERKPFFA
jgi:hypothetical protein